MHDFGCVHGEYRAGLAELSLDYCENLLEFRNSLCFGGHQGVAAWNGRHLGDPTGGLIPI